MIWSVFEVNDALSTEELGEDKGPHQCLSTQLLRLPALELACSPENAPTAVNCSFKLFDLLCGPLIGQSLHFNRLN